MKRGVRIYLTGVAGFTVVATLLMVVPRAAQTQVYSTPVRDIDNPARQPIFLRSFVNVAANAENGFAFNVYQVPPGKRLIISYIGVFDTLGTGKVPLQVFVVTHGQAGTTSIANAPITIGSPMADIPANRPYGASQQVYMFGNPGDQIDLGVFTDGGPSPASFFPTISGYLVNLP